MIGHPRARLRALKERVTVRSLARTLRTQEMGRLQPWGNSETRPETIVSLTTYGERLQTVDLAIRSVLAGTVLPNRIILWLDDETNPGSLPDTLEELRSFGVEIRRGCENLRGHKKYFWAMQENPAAIVVTIDDDVMYPSDMLASLIEAYDKHPRSVVSRRPHRITWNDGHLLPYSEWDWEWHAGTQERMDLLPTGVGAVLYPPSCLAEGAFDASAIKACALNGDDIWLKVCEVLAGTSVTWAPCRRMHPHTIPESQATALNATNVKEGRNDVILQATLKHFGISESEFIEMLA